MVQWLGLRASTAGGMGLIPGGGSKIPHAAGHGQNKQTNRKGFGPLLNLTLLYTCVNISSGSQGLCTLNFDRFCPVALLRDGMWKSSTFLKSFPSKGDGPGPDFWHTY